MNKIFYILFSLVAVVLILAAMGAKKTDVNVDEISIFGDSGAQSGDIISGGAQDTGDIFGTDAAAQGNVFGDLGST